MKRIVLLILPALLLAGCAASTERAAPPDTTPETEPVTETVTEATETEAEEVLPQDPIMTMLRRMTVEEKVGQLFLARCPEENAEADAGEYALGGYILFGRDFDGQTPDSLRASIAAYQNAASIPMLIAVDEEGGTVCRVSNHRAFRETRFLSPRALFAQGGMKAVLAAETEKSELLHSLGINVNMAPVCDVCTEPSAFLYDRSLGESPEVTGEFAAGAVETMARYGIGSVLKHFPGYGENADTHVGIAVDERSLEQLEAVDLVPFGYGIRAGCGGILVSHTVVKALDEKLPASLSPAVHSYLREKMDFDGVIVTDALDMDAIAKRYGMEEAAVLAVIAGNDLLCTTDYRSQIPAVVAAVADGRIDFETLDAAVYRVLTWKANLGLI